MNSFLKYTAYALSLALVVSALFFLYLNAWFPFNKFSTAQDEIDKPGRLSDLNDIKTKNAWVSTDLASTPVFKELPGEEMGTKYKFLSETVKTMKSDIDAAEVAGDRTKADILFMKGGYYRALASSTFFSSQQDDARNKTIIDSYSGLFDNIFKISEVAETENRSPRFLRRLYVYSVLFIYKNTENPDLFVISNFSRDKFLLTLLEKYDLNKDIASLLYIDSLFSESDLPNDNMMMAEKMLALAKVLNWPEAESNSELKGMILEKTTKYQQDFPQARITNLSNSKEENRVRPLMSFSSALSLLSLHNRALSDDSVRVAYSSANKAFNEEVRSEEDVLRYVKFVNDINYLSFLYTKNNYKLDSEAGDVLKEIKKFLSTFSTYPEISVYYKRYLIAGQKSPGMHDPARKNLYQISATDIELKKLLLENGVEL